MKRALLIIFASFVLLALHAEVWKLPAGSRLQENSCPQLTLYKPGPLQQARRQALEHDRQVRRQLVMPAVAPSDSAGRKKWRPDVRFFRLTTNPDVTPYKFLDDMTFVGVPLFIAGIAIKGEKAAFRQNYSDTFHPNTRLVTNFHTSIDDYMQYFGPALTVGLKLGGYEGRSEWPRLLAGAGMGYATMAILVNTIKYTAKEVRPDGSTANSWPSGHTATSFVGATLLHKEYGLTRSPWFSVAGYGVATATGIMRVLNNRHWVSDILSGAGIGIFAGELGYALTDVFFKQKGLLRGDLPFTSTRPSFFSLSMGFGLGTHDLSFGMQDLVATTEQRNFLNSSAGQNADLGLDVTFRPATTVDVEGAYFFNRYVGVGGRLRVRAMTAKQWGAFAERAQRHSVGVAESLLNYYAQSNPQLTPAQLAEKQQHVHSELLGDRPLVASEEKIIESDYLTEFQASAGIYFNIPLGQRFALGTKVLIGGSHTQELDVDAHFTGNQKHLEYQAGISQQGLSNLNITRLEDAGKSYDVTWQYLTLGAERSAAYSTGLSFTYRYKANFCFRAFVDYDYTRKTFNLTFDPYYYVKEAVPNAVPLFVALGENLESYKFRTQKPLHHFTIGVTLVVAL